MTNIERQAMETTVEEEVHSFLTDTCILAGGAFYNGDFSYINWKVDYPNVCDLPINYMELFMAAVGVIKWASIFR